MRELDDAALEMLLRQTLRAKAGPADPSLTAEDLETRAAQRRRRRLRRGMLLMGLAAVIALPASALVVGAIHLTRPQQDGYEAVVVRSNGGSDLHLVAIDEAGRERVLTTPSSSTYAASDETLFVVPDAISSDGWLAIGGGSVPRPGAVGLSGRSNFVVHLIDLTGRAAPHTIDSGALAAAGWGPTGRLGMIFHEDTLMVADPSTGAVSGPVHVSRRRPRVRPLDRRWSEPGPRLRGRAAAPTRRTMVRRTGHPPGRRLDARAFDRRARPGHRSAQRRVRRAYLRDQCSGIGLGVPEPGRRDRCRGRPVGVTRGVVPGPAGARPGDRRELLRRRARDLAPPRQLRARPLRRAGPGRRTGSGPADWERGHPTGGHRAVVVGPRQDLFWSPPSTRNGATSNGRSSWRPMTAQRRSTTAGSRDLCRPPRQRPGPADRSSGTSAPLRRATVAVHRSEVLPSATLISEAGDEPVFCSRWTTTRAGRRGPSPRRPSVRSR